MIRLTVCGSFGFGNAGDEAIPYAIADIAKHLEIPIEVQTVTRFDKPALRDVVGLGVQDKDRLEGLRHRPLIVSGGGIIQNTDNAVIFRVGQLLHPSFASLSCLFGVSVEPGVSYGWKCKWKLRRLLRQFGKVYTRDKLSESTLNKILPKIKTETIGDVVLWLRPERGDLASTLGLPSKFAAIVLAPRWTEDRTWQSWIVNELHVLAKQLNTSLVFVPMNGLSQKDILEHREIANSISKLSPNTDVRVIDPSLSPRGIASVLAKADLAISMRLHGCVIAYAQRTPCVGLAYHPKLAGFFNTIQWPKAFLPEKIPPLQTGPLGYSFPDLNLKAGELVDKAITCSSESDFSSLNPLKERSSAVFQNFLDEAGLIH